MLQNYKNWLFETKIGVLNESDVDLSQEFAIVRTGGSIGNKPEFPMPVGGEIGTVIQTSDDDLELKEIAKRYRKNLSPGEKKYYGIRYLVIRLTNSKRKQSDELKRIQSAGGDEIIDGE